MTAPGTWARSYTPGFTLTSITRTLPLSRFCASQSVVTSGPVGTGVAAKAMPQAQPPKPSATAWRQRNECDPERTAKSVCPVILIPILCVDGQRDVRGLNTL